MKYVSRLLRFNAVGLFNLAVKLDVLSLLKEAAHLDYRVATALAVETALLRGFAWHHCWMWQDRSDGITRRLVYLRLLRYHATTGVVALAVNLGVMDLLVGGVGLRYFPAAIVATGTAGLAGFVLSHNLVFRRPSRDTAV